MIGWSRWASETIVDSLVLQTFIRMRTTLEAEIISLVELNIGGRSQITSAVKNIWSPLKRQKLKEEVSKIRKPDNGC